MHQADRIPVATFRVDDFVYPHILIAIGHRGPDSFLDLMLEKFVSRTVLHRMPSPALLKISENGGNFDLQNLFFELHGFFPQYLGMVVMLVFNMLDKQHRKRHGNEDDDNRGVEKAQAGKKSFCEHISSWC